jgi:hypothetical protein
MTCGFFYDVKSRARQPSYPSPRGGESDQSFDAALISMRDASKLGNGSQQPKRLIVNWSSYKGLTVDTLAHRGDEGRGYLR